MESPKAFATDILRGGDAIAEFIYGDPVRKRSIYHLVRTAQLPVFRLGNVICARRSALIAWIAEQEQAGVGRAA